MLARCIGGARLLGAQVVLVGLHPELATALVSQRFDLTGVLSAPTLAAALRIG